MNKLLLTISFAMALSTAGAQSYQPSPEILKAQQEFQDQKFGIFLHWGIYSMMGQGEWVMNNRSINYQEYTHLADGFYPSKFDADSWVAAFKDAGARYITFTSRHHDGFSMFKTATSNYNIVDGTPYKHDVLADLAAACHKQGISLHLYYSHLDWHRPDYPLGRTGRKLGRPTDQQNYDEYLKFMNQQLTELLTNYGRVDCIWFDGWWDHDSDPTPFDWRFDEQCRLIHGLQPQCLVANNHHMAPNAGEDIQIFERDVPGENKAGLSGQKVSQLPLETCQTMNDSWGYDITDKNYKTADELIRLLVNTAGRNANLLLNIGPRPDGMLPQESLDRLKAIGKWLRANGETIYGTRGGVVSPRDWGVTTQKGNKLYVHILNWKDKSLFLPVENVKRAVMFTDKKPVGVTRCPGGVTLSLSAVPTGVDTIVEITLK
ncbi:MAG: alpha-L-fucosidase [Prevotella sp.]|jgi:alpha-L-fucosidase